MVIVLYLLMSTLIISKAEAHHPNLGNRNLTPAPVSGPIGKVAADDGPRRAQARAAHWSYTWSYMQGNLYARNLDRACGYGIDYCSYQHADFGSWAEYHSVRVWFDWLEQRPTGSYFHCGAHVRVVDHDEPTTDTYVSVNAKEVYSYDDNNPGDGSCKVPTYEIP